MCNTVPSTFQTGAVYISTEDVFPSKRLHQLTQCFVRNHTSHSAVKVNFSDNIFIEHAADVVSSKNNFSYQVYKLLTEVSCLTAN